MWLRCRTFNDTGVCVRLAGLVCTSVRLAPTDDLKETWFGLNASLTYVCKQARHGRSRSVSHLGLNTFFTRTRAI